MHDDTLEAMAQETYIWKVFYDINFFRFPN